MTSAGATAVDTSVAIPLLVAGHPAHSATRTWARGRRLKLCGHALAETYSVLSRLPSPFGVSGPQAVELLGNFAEPFVLSEQAARAAPQQFALLGITGGAVYDGLVALAAREQAAVLATRDARARSTYEAVGVEVDLIPSNGISG
ncbi:MAG: type II toxin-antitoxin system VapC family toxin [Micrococcales bacterium]|nr:type II toxin-antitoxin system VapC family toxin [Micrococcales bacterium]